jgi:hypothetical protein
MVRQPLWARASSLSRLHDHTAQSVRLLLLGDQPGAETSTLQYATRKIQTSMPHTGFEPAIQASERLHTHALDRTATWIDPLRLQFNNYATPYDVLICNPTVQIGGNIKFLKLTG